MEANEPNNLTPEKSWIPLFLVFLEQTGNVSAAAAGAGISRWTAYDRRQHDSEFAAAWQHALDVAIDALELEARRRALEGCDEPVFYQGAECGRIRRYSDTLMIFLLKAHRPAMYREKIEQQHSGQVTVRVVYDDIGNPGSPAPSASWPAGDPLEHK